MKPVFWKVSTIVLAIMVVLMAAFIVMLVIQQNRLGTLLTKQFEAQPGYAAFDIELGESQESGSQPFTQVDAQRILEKAKENFAKVDEGIEEGAQQISVGMEMAGEVIDLVSPTVDLASEKMADLIKQIKTDIPGLEEKIRQIQAKIEKNLSESAVSEEQKQ
ncbi:MAG: hypothetical protein OXR68_01005 [Alphaproteobacteria bacterium]|nr:hypothetical protein [Alphaproteobacteria bacterium]